MSYDRTKSQHECAVPGCGKLIHRSLLMCAPHWRRVPKSIALRVYFHWRNGSSEQYLAARAEAIQSVSGGQP